MSKKANKERMSRVQPIVLKKEDFGRFVKACVQPKTELPDNILQNISITVKKYGDVKGQPSLKERIRKALLYQEWDKECKKLLGVTA